MKTGTVSKLSICLRKSKYKPFSLSNLKALRIPRMSFARQHSLVCDPHLPIDIVSLLDTFLWKQV